MSLKYSFSLPIPDFAYRFDILFDVLRRFAFPARQIVHASQLWRITAGELVSYRGVGNEIELRCSSSDKKARVLSVSSHIFGLDSDLTDFYSFAQEDPRLWHVIQPLVGLPIMRSETVFEALVSLIIEQHISWKNALQAQRRLMEIFDTGQTLGDITVYDFPRPEQLAEVTQVQLMPLKITHRRMDLIIKIARDVVDGMLDLEALREVESSEAYQTLMGIKGIGHWTAGNVIGRAFGQFPYISHNDVALQAAIQFYFHADEGKKSAKQVIDTLEPYGDYAGLVGHFTLLRWVLDRYPIVAL